MRLLMLAYHGSVWGSLSSSRGYKDSLLSASKRAQRIQEKTTHEHSRATALKTAETLIQHWMKRRADRPRILNYYSMKLPLTHANPYRSLFEYFPVHGLLSRKRNARRVIWGSAELRGPEQWQQGWIGPERLAVDSLISDRTHRHGGYLWRHNGWMAKTRTKKTREAITTCETTHKWEKHNKLLQLSPPTFKLSRRRDWIIPEVFDRKGRDWLFDRVLYIRTGNHHRVILTWC